MAKSKKKTVPTLVNPPAVGTAHILGNWGVVTIDENMTEEQVDYAISIGLPYWTKPEDEASQIALGSQSAD